MILISWKTKGIIWWVIFDSTDIQELLKYTKMIFIDNLSKSYNGNYLFSNVTIGIKRGMRIGLVGANGAGKTTLLRILIGEEDFDSGNVQSDKKTSMGYLPQELITGSDSTILEEAQKSVPALKKIEEQLSSLNDVIRNDPNKSTVTFFFEMLKI